MFMSVVTRDTTPTVYPELAGARVIMTGLTQAAGVDLARAFADHKARLIIQSPEASPELTALGSLLAESASELSLYTEPFACGDDAVKFAQRAAKASGGVDAVINIITISAPELDTLTELADIEDFISDKLLTPTLITRIAGNRMRVTMTEGLILNVVVMPAARSEADKAIAGLVRTALAAMTRGEAQMLADEAIRVNAIGPRGLMSDETSGACLTSEADIAALALYLASKKGRQLSGHLFDAEGVAGRRC